MTRLIAITGPIAAGATTLASKITADLGWQPLFEENVEADSPYFSLFHKAPAKYALHNQLVFLARSAARHLAVKNNPPNDYIQDFTPFEHNEVYSRILYQRGYIDQKEQDLLDRISAVLNTVFITPNVLVYRPLLGNLLLERVRSRRRPSEQALELSYLQGVSNHFDIWIKSWIRSPVITVDPTLDVLHDEAGYQKFLGDLKALL